MTKYKQRDMHKIIIVEDDPDLMLEYQEEAQRFAKFEILDITGSATQAYNSLKTHQPDIIIVDIHLAEGDGEALISTIRKERGIMGRTPYIMAVTAFTSPILMDRLKTTADFIFNKRSTFQVAHVFQKLLSLEKTKDLPTKPAHDHRFDIVKRNRENIPNFYESVAEVEIDSYKFDIRRQKSRRQLVIALSHAMRSNPNKNINIKEICQWCNMEFNTDDKLGAFQSSLHRFIEHMFKETPKDTLKNLFPDYVTAKEIPSVLFWLTYTSTKLRRQLNITYFGDDV